MTQNLTNSGIFLIHTIGGLCVILVLLRLVMQLARFTHRDLVCAAIVKITNPAVKPLQRILPAIGRIDLATLAAAWALQLVTIMLMVFLSGDAPLFHPVYVAWAMVGVFSTIVDMYFFILLFAVIASWILPFSNNLNEQLQRQVYLVYYLAEPLCAPARKLLPPTGGFDFSIILVFIAITLIDNYLVIKPLANMFGVPRGLILGL